MEVNLISCPKCGEKAPEGTKFCPDCGASMSATKKCPNCGAQMAENAKFCPECGKQA